MHHISSIYFMKSDGKHNIICYVRDDSLRDILFLSRSISASFSGNSLCLILSNAANIDH